MELTQELLKFHLKYTNGHLWWIVPSGKRTKVGQQFGGNKQGYRRGRLFGKYYYEHRLIWFYFYGVWPMYIDHINGDRNDNRPENLRVCTNQENQFNKNSYGVTSKYKGVSWDKSTKKWRASHCYNSTYKHLGRYNTEQEAAEAYRNATQHLHKEYANYG